MQYRIEWIEDWLVGSHIHEYGEVYDREPETCEGAVLYVTQPCGHEEVGASLFCIDDASDEYRREIERELIAEYEGRAAV